MDSTKEIHILLVEDNEGDVLLTREAFMEGKIINQVSVARDGVEALDFLYKRGDFSLVASPDLILLDINLPRIDGKEVLSIIKKDDQLKRIPVLMLTTSSAQKDITESYDNHANCYITKPVDFNAFTHAIRTIEDFWLSVVQLPSFK